MKGLKNCFFDSPTKAQMDNPYGPIAKSSSVMNCKASIIKNHAIKIHFRQTESA